MAQKLREKFIARFGIDLVQAARNELDFLKLVDEHPSLYQGPILKNAIRRYELYWLPLASKEGVESRFLAAPLDIAWVWHAHMLSPLKYSDDCINIVHKMVDHALLNSSQRCGCGLQRAKKLWERQYPNEPFEVDLTQPPEQWAPYRSKLLYDLEEACQRKCKFYYQVSLPHYKDDKFLTMAVGRYADHLRLKKENPRVFMVPCYDTDLIWHAHQLHPVTYWLTTMKLLGRVLNHDDSVADRTPGSKLCYSEMETRVLWKAAGLDFAKSGAMYRGDPPDPNSPRTGWLYADYAASIPCEYKVEIINVEVLNVDNRHTYLLRLRGPNKKYDFSQVLWVSQCSFRPPPFTFDVEGSHTITISLYRKTFLWKKFIASCRTNLSSYLVPFGGTAAQTITLRVPLQSGHFTAEFTIALHPPTVKKCSFTVEPELYFIQHSHPSMVLSCPNLMLSPSDLAQPSLPCESSIHGVLDWRGREAFLCRVTHSSAAMLSAVEIFDVHGQIVASSHTIGCGTLPEREATEDPTKCVTLDHLEGGTAMLIRGQKDWAVCIGKWLQTSHATREQQPCFPTIEVFRLFGERSWCVVRKSRGGLYLIEVDYDTVVQVNLNTTIEIIIPPSAQSIPEILALAFSLAGPLWGLSEESLLNVGVRKMRRGVANAEEKESIKEAKEKEEERNANETGKEGGAMEKKERRNAEEKENKRKAKEKEEDRKAWEREIKERAKERKRRIKKLLERERIREATERRMKEWQEKQERQRIMINHPEGYAGCGGCGGCGGGCGD